jgi:hypothetical protein
MTTAEKKYINWINEDPRIVKLNDDNSEYVPISCVQEDLLIGYNGYTKMELLREAYHSEGLSGVGRLHYKHPITGEWLFQDGSASIPFNKGMRLDFPSLAGHIMLSCAKKIGRRFGQMLNRDKDDSPVDFEAKSPVKGKQKPPAVKMKPDSRIQQQFNDAVEMGGEGLVKALEDIYEIKYTGLNGTTKTIVNAES